VPPLGGPLVQYHVHDDLCWAGEDGAFAALEGISGGQVRAGEEVLCDHALGTR
jgi:hypothetical protein